jgi:hypothetical protein
MVKRLTSEVPRHSPPLNEKEVRLAAVHNMLTVGHFSFVRIRYSSFGHAIVLYRPLCPFLDVRRGFGEVTPVFSHLKRASFNAINELVSSRGDQGQNRAHLQ